MAKITEGETAGFLDELRLEVARRRKLANFRQLQVVQGNLGGRVSSGGWREEGRGGLKILEVASPFFSAIVLFKNQPFPQGFWWFSRKKDPWKEWGSYP